VVNEKFMAWVRSRGCALRGKHLCVGVVTFHHLRPSGSQKNDEWGVGLCLAGHLHDFGQQSVERLGKKGKFEEHWGVDLAAEAQKNVEEWRALNR
jgi:hypothetical protein